MTGAAHPQSSFLQGRRVLVVEDEYMIAREMVEMLLQAGAQALGPVPSAAPALELVAAEQGHVDAALLDVNLRDGQVWPLVDARRARGARDRIRCAGDAGRLRRPAALREAGVPKRPYPHPGAGAGILIAHRRLTLQAALACDFEQRVR